VGDIRIIAPVLDHRAHRRIRALPREPVHGHGDRIAGKQPDLDGLGSLAAEQQGQGPFGGGSSSGPGGEPGAQRGSFSWFGHVWIPCRSAFSLRRAQRGNAATNKKLSHKKHKKHKTEFADTPCWIDRLNSRGVARPRITGFLVPLVLLVAIFGILSAFIRVHPCYAKPNPLYGFAFVCNLKKSSLFFVLLPLIFLLFMHDIFIFFTTKNTKSTKQVK